MRRTVVLVLAVLLLAACGSAPTPRVPSPDPAAVENEPAPEPPAELPFGATHTWPNGDTVSITAPEPLASATTSERYVRVVKVSVTVSNAGPAAKQANSYVLNATADGRPVDGIATADLVTAAGFVAPGASQTFDAAYQLPEAGPVELEVQVFGEMFDPMRPVVFFRGTA